MTDNSNSSGASRFIFYTLIFILLSPLIVAIWGYRCCINDPYRHKPWIIAALGEIAALWMYLTVLSDPNISESLTWMLVILLASATILNGITIFKNLKAIKEFGTF